MENRRRWANWVKYPVDKISHVCYKRLINLVINNLKIIDFIYTL
jgi:hypothetical protein